CPIDGRKELPNGVEVIETFRRGPSVPPRAPVELVFGQAGHERPRVGLERLDLAQVVGKLGIHGRPTWALRLRSSRRGALIRSAQPAKVLVGPCHRSSFTLRDSGASV